MDISRFFIDRPRFAGVISIFIFLIGVLAIFRLPISEYPEVAPPQIVVRAQFPGANPRVISETVATPLEEQINGVENLLYFDSQASADGSLTLTVTFKIGTNPEVAETAVQNRINRALPRVPDIVRQIGVTTEKSSPNLTMVVHLVSPDNSHDALYLRNYGQLNVRDELLRIPGMGSVLMFGAGDYAMRIWLDPAKLAARSITTGEVIAAIREQNAQVAAGTVGASPVAQGHRVPARRQHAGPARQRGGVRRHHRAHRARDRRPDPDPRPRPGRALVGLVFAAQPAQQQGSRGDRDLPGAGLERARALERRARQDGRAQARLSRRAWATASSTTRRASCRPRSRR